MFTVCASPDHILPTEVQAPMLKDPVGSGNSERRRLWMRTLKRWELVFIGTAERLEAVGGLIDIAQGDTPIWFDGAGALEIVDPILIAVGNGTDTDFNMPHRHVFMSSAVIYINGAAVNTWYPIGGDGITMDKIRITPAPGNFSQIKGKYRRKAKVFIETDQAVARERVYRDPFHVEQSVGQVKYWLQESPT